MKQRRAVVTGLGAVSGFGPGVGTLWAALLDGRRAMREHAAFPVGPVALAPQLPLEAPARAAALALHAAREALADAGDPPRGARLGLSCGTTLGGIGEWLPVVRGDAPAARRWSYAGPAHEVAAAVDARGPLEVSSVACASSNVALGTALDWVREGRCDLVLAGGVDALQGFVVAGFAALKALDPAPCRPFDRNRRGLNLGEGAAFLVIEEEAHAERRGARARAALDGWGIAADAVHMTGPDRDGRGAARAMQAAIADAGAAPDDVDLVSAHGTATVFNDLMEAKALALALGARAAHVPVHSIKSALGHTLGAAGALEALVCVRALETGQMVPTPGLVEIDPEIVLDVVRDGVRAVDARTALSTSSGFGGTNAALLLRKV
jgi:3-oxoacyl-[acyl-carrier-protein] synthase II